VRDWATGPQASVLAGPSRLCLLRELGHGTILAHAASVNKHSFPIPVSIKSVSNFQNPYLFEYLFKNHEIGSVGFVISISIKEKYEFVQ
jgi:hypothetical protein